MPNSQPSATARIRIGCAGLPQGLKRPRYFEQLAFLETASTYFSLPRPSVLQRWRASASETRRKGAAATSSAGFSLVALGAITDPSQPAPTAPGTNSAGETSSLGHFRDTPIVRDATTAVLDAARALNAEAVLFRSPPSFSPSSTSRDAMKRYFTEIAPPRSFEGAAVAWEPQGLWELRDAARLSEELGLICACDPLSRDPTMPELDPADLLPREAAYFRVTGLGRPRRALDEGTLESLLLTAERFERCWLVFATLDKSTDARNCQRLLDAMSAAD